MTEEDVRRIVREELAEIQRERGAETKTMLAAYRAQWLAKAADQPGDGPTVRSIKRTLREETT